MTVDLSREQRGDHTVVAVRGDLDLRSRDRLDAYLTSACENSDAKVVIDLSGLGFMDTSSLAVIVSHWKGLSASGGSLVLAGAQYRTAKVLWITGLAKRMQLYDSVEEALAASPVPD